MKRSTVRSAILMATAAVLLAVWTVPVLWAVLTSFKDEKEVLAYPPTIVFDATVKNFREVLTGPTNIVPNLTSSLIIAVATTILTIVIAVPAAYAFARLKLPGRRPLGFYVLATQLVPPIGLIIPYFLIMNRIGWMDSYRGLVLIYLTFSLPVRDLAAGVVLRGHPARDGGSRAPRPREPPAGVLARRAAAGAGRHRRSRWSSCSSTRGTSSSSP